MSRFTRSGAARRILGIDPGTATTGYGLIEKTKRGLVSKTFGCINTPAAESRETRLRILFQELSRLLRRTKPQEVAVEELFFSKNVKTAMAVAEARGVILLAVARQKIPVRSFTPQAVKQSVAAYGRAEKSQIGNMVARLLGLQDIPRPDDAADALAVAICAANHQRGLT